MNLVKRMFGIRYFHFFEFAFSSNATGHYFGGSLWFKYSGFLRGCRVFTLGLIATTPERAEGSFLPFSFRRGSLGLLDRNTKGKYIAKSVSLPRQRSMSLYTRQPQRALSQGCARHGPRARLTPLLEHSTLYSWEQVSFWLCTPPGAADQKRGSVSRP